MNKNKVRGLEWNLKKLRGSVLHFTQNKNWLLIDGKKNQHKNKNENPWIYKIPFMTCDLYFRKHCISKRKRNYPKSIKGSKGLTRGASLQTVTYWVSVSLITSKEMNSNKARDEAMKRLNFMENTGSSNKAMMQQAKENITSPPS